MGDKLATAQSPGRSLEGHAQLTTIFESAIEDVRSHLQCKICVRPMYEPYITNCGHTFCYSCLAQWFSNHRRNKTCPECRALVSTQPIPAYVIRDIVQSFTCRPELLELGETTESQKRTQGEEASIVERDKSNTDALTGGLFRGCFRKGPTRAVMIDHEDNVARCPTCGWELQEHGWCGRCGQALDTDDEIHSMTNLTDSESYDSEEDVVDDLHPNDRDMWDQSIDLHANGLPIIMHNGGIRIVGANPQALLRRGHSTQSIPDRRRRESLPSAISVTSTDESLGSEEDDGDTDLDGFIEDDHTDTDINNDGHDDSSDGTSPIYLGVHQYGPSTVTIDSEDDESDENTTIRSEGSRTESAEESNSDGEPQNDMVSEDELSSDSSLASVPQNRRSKRPRVLEDDEEDSENDTDSDVARSRSRRRLTAHIT